MSEPHADPLQKRKIKHDGVVSECDHKIRKCSIESEGLILELCGTLKRDLVLSESRTRQVVGDEFVKLKKEIDNGGLFGGLEGCEVADGGGRARRCRILSVKHRMLSVLSTITSSVHTRLSSMSLFLAEMHELNMRWKYHIEAALHTMFETLTSIAWADNEKCWSIVQHKESDVNLGIVSNAKTVADLVGKLHSREVGIQQELFQEFTENWSEVLDKMAASCIVWLEKRYVSSTYLDPPERRELIALYMERLVGTAGEASRRPNSKGLCKTWSGNVQSMLDLVDTLSSSEADDTMKWPAPGGRGHKGWLEAWQPHSEVTPESLQIAKIVVPEKQRQTPATKAEEWRTSARVFGSQLATLQAEFITRAIVNEQELNKKAATDHAVLLADLHAILLDVTTFPYPKVVTSDDIIELVDCTEAAITLGAKDGKATYTAGDRTAQLVALSLVSETTVWGEMYSLTCSLEEDGVRCDLVHAFAFNDPRLDAASLSILQQLLDAHGVTHNFENETLLEGHMQECTHVTTEIDALQRVLGTYIFTADTAEVEGDTPWAQFAQRADKVSEPQLAALKRESGIFLNCLQHAMHEQAWLFESTILSAPAALIPNMKGAGLFLLRTVSEFTRVLQEHEEKYMILDLDYTDEDKGYEKRFADLVKKMCESPDKAQTTEHFREAVTVLHDIEHAYSEVKVNKQARLHALQEEVVTLSDELLCDLCTFLRLAQEAEVEPEAEAATLSIEGVDFSVIAEPHALLFGEKDDMCGEAPLRPASPLSKVQPPEPKTPPVVELDPKKGKKKGKEPLPEEPVHDPVASAASEEFEGVKKRVAVHLEPLRSDLFFLDNSKNAILANLRGSIVGWFLKYSASVKQAIELHARQTVTELEAWLNGKLRGHQRRVPSLASKEYDGRIRELVETDEKKHREFTWIGQRFSQSLDAAKLEVQNKQSAFEKELQHLATRRKQLQEAVNSAALSAHRKQAEGHQHAVAGKVDSCASDVNRMLAQAKKTMAKEGVRYLEDHCKTFAEGGLMSEEEVGKNREAIASMESDAQAAIAKLKGEVTENKKQQLSSLKKEWATYEAAYQENTDDLALIKWQNEALAAVKGKVNVIISSSVDAEKKLDAEVAALEEMVRTLMAKSKGSVLKEGEGGGVWDTDMDPAVTAILRKAKLARDTKLKETHAFRAVGLLDVLSRLVYTRGMLLGCLAKQLTFYNIGPHTYFAKKAMEAEEAKDEFKAEPLLSAAEKLIEGFWNEGDKVVVEYFKKVNGRVPSRGSHISETEAKHKEYLGGKLNDIKSVLVSHITTATPEYKKQVIRISLAVPRVPHEVFTSLFNNALCMMDDGAGGCKRMFDAMHAMGMHKRQEHSKRVKGCMVNPGNREMIVRTDKEEVARQQVMQHILDQFQGILLREEASIYHIFTQQAVHASASLFRIMQSLVSPSMIVTGTDVMVGNHRSLKRLRIAKQRKESQQAAAQSTAPGLVRKKSERDAKVKGKPARGKDSPATADGRGGTVYPGVFMVMKNPFAEYQERNQGVVIKDHLGEAKPVEDVKKAPPNSKAPAKKGKAAEVVQEEEVQQTPALEGPEEPMFATVIQQRAQLYNLFVKLYEDEVGLLNSAFEDMKSGEAKWARNWEELVKSLMPGGS